MVQRVQQKKQPVRVSRAKARKKKLQALRHGVVVSASVLGVGGCIAGGYWAYHSDVFSSVAGYVSSVGNVASRDVGLRVRHIYIEGREKTPQEVVLSALGVRLGSSIFELSPEEAKERLEKISTIRQASTERILPDAIRVVLDERKPVAIWQHKKTQNLIDKDGVVLVGEKVSNHPELVLFVGEGASQRASEMLRVLDTIPVLKKQIVAVMRIGDRRWNLRLKNGVEVLLPEEGMEKALSRLVDMDKKQKLLSKPILTVDMRLPERMFIKLSPENVARRVPKAHGSRSET